MSPEEVLEWWDVACLSGWRQFVWGPPADLIALEELLEARRTASPEE